MIRPAELIERKRDGGQLTPEEITELVLGHTRGEIPDYQLSAFCMAVYFKGLTPDQGDLCIEHLRRRIDELRAEDLEYQAEEALTILSQVVAEQERFDLFEDLAREMGSREWQRIIRLADRAVKKRKRPLASRVFEAALTEGSHLDFLGKKYEQLKSGKWSPDPRK